MSAARWTDRTSDGSGEAEPVERPVEADGPFDATGLDLEQTDAVGRLNFESIRVPMPDGARLQIEKLPDGRLKAVHVMVECGRLSVSALAAPKTGRLWPELADEVARSLQKDGARVRVEPGMWGREVVAWAGEAKSRFVGVDGQRWMLYGISTGPATQADEAADILRDMIRGTIVVRGSKPYPVRTVLPLSLPEHLVPLLEQLEATSAAAEPDARRPAGGAVRGSAAGRPAPGSGSPGSTPAGRGPPAGRPDAEPSGGAAGRSDAQGSAAAAEGRTASGRTSTGSISTGRTETGRAETVAHRIGRAAAGDHHPDDAAGDHHPADAGDAPCASPVDRADGLGRRRRARSVAQ